MEDGTMNMIQGEIQTPTRQVYTFYTTLFYLYIQLAKHFKTLVNAFRCVILIQCFNFYVSEFVFLTMLKFGALNIAKMQVWKL